MDDLGSTASDLPILEQYEGFSDLENEPFEHDLTEESNDDDDEWLGKSLHARWTEVIEQLLHQKTRWDADDDSLDASVDGWKPIPDVLDPKRKRSLAGAEPKNKSSPTVLHTLAVNLESDKFNELPQRTQIKIVEYLLQDRMENSRYTAAQDPVLTRAIEYDNIAFIEFILDHCTSHLQGLLDEQDLQGANCLHHLFKSHFREVVDHFLKFSSARTAAKIAHQPYREKKKLHLDATIKILARFVEHARPSTIIASDNLGNTPIHYAMDYRICRVLGLVHKYPIQVLKLVEKGEAMDMNGQFNCKHESPYLYLVRTRRDCLNLQKSNQERSKLKVAAMVRTKAAFVGEKLAKPEIPDYNITTSTKPSWEDLHPKMNPRDLVAAKRRPFIEVIAALPSKDGRTEPKRDNISGAKDPGLKQAPAGGQMAISASPIEKLSASSQSADSFHIAKLQSVNETSIEKQMAHKPGPVEEHKQFRKAAETMLLKMKLHYIRNRSDIEAKELLYGRVASDKNPYFDATHLTGKSPSDVADLVLMLANPGGFEDTLSYVGLPVLSYTSEVPAGSNPNAKPYDANERRQRESGGNENELKGRNSAVAVFDKLAEVGVSNILRLIVEEDTESLPHSDSAIERAIRGEDSLNPDNKRRDSSPIAVEVWDWRKFDLSTDVIRYCSPGVCVVNIYWSGNQTVLRGWASDEGILRLYQESYQEAEKVYCLKTIIVHWSPGFEGLKRCEALLLDFKKRIELRTTEVAQKDAARSEGVAVHYKLLASGKTGGSSTDSDLVPFTFGNLRPSPDHGWIESMESFRLALMKIHRELPQDLKPERIKVALIDDGIDRTDLFTYGKRVEVTGMSYWSAASGRALANPSWHQSTHGHGTIMANSIVRVNPWVSLYAMRVQEEVDFGHRNDISIRIYAGSAARAIEDAIIREVDIISISWTIRNLAKQDGGAFRSHETGALDALKKAIDKAKDRGILLFCSASDNIQNKGTDTLPYSQAGEYAFRIGAADAYGWSDKATEDQRSINYYFPGNQVADDFNPRAVRASELKYRDGSYVATALAAGLASLILYLTNVMRAHNDKDGRPDSRTVRSSNQLAKRDRIKRAFENIMNMDDNYKDKKFLPVWSLFGKKAQEISDSKDVAEKWEILEEVCTKLAG